jgi:glycosyltransferase involved in cell wall biosynthesis
MYRVFHVFGSLKLGGLQIRSAALLQALGPNFTHAVMALDGNFESLRESRSSIEFVPTPARSSSLLQPLLLSQVIRRIRPDLLVTYSWGAFDALIGGSLTGMCPVIHNECYAVDVKTRHIIARRIFLNRIHRTVVPSKTLRDFVLTRYKVHPDKVCRILNGVDTQKFAPGRDYNVRRRLGLDPDAVVFGSVGRLAREKNLSFLLRTYAASGLNSTRLVIVGDGPCRSELERLSRELCIHHRVIFAGAVRDPVPYFAAFDIFVMSSQTEQMPMALLEAMATGLPVISTGVGDIAEVLGTDKAPQIVNVDDESQYRTSMQTMVENPRMRAALGLLNRSRCVSLYGIHQFVEGHRVLYTQALTRSINPFSPAGRG